MTGDYSPGSILDTCFAAEMPDTYSVVALLSHKNHCSTAAGNSGPVPGSDSETVADRSTQVEVL